MDSDAVANTPLGPVVGEEAKVQGDRLSIFRGIPYAVPPVGERRWKPAEVLSQPWKGERKAKVFSPACVQPLSRSSPYHDRLRTLLQMSEDCLYLNIWTPADLSADELASLPVMVWIHGGSLLNGAASDPRFDGAQLARKGVVVVSINYRLGVFGYFAHPELTAESPHHASGNYGVTDQIAALQWVQRNIAAFGGDPGNVTVFGQSAGGYSAIQLVASPLAKGLFHKAIAESGGLKFLQPLKRPGYGMPAAEESGVRFARSVGAGTLGELRAMPAGKIMEVVNQADVADSSGYSTIPNLVLDGWVFPAQLYEIYERGEQNDVPLIIGFTSNEGYQMIENTDWKAHLPSDVQDYAKMVRARYGHLADEYLSLYPAGDPATVDHHAWIAPYRDGFVTWPSQKVVRESRHVSSNVYLYYFDQRSPWQERGGAAHSTDLPYVFNNWLGIHPTQADVRLADTIQKYWVCFAKTGAPEFAGGPHWRPHTDKDRAYMAFRDGKAVPGKNLLPGAFEFWERIFDERRRTGDLPWTFISIGLYAPEKRQ